MNANVYLQACKEVGFLMYHLGELILVQLFKNTKFIVGKKNLQIFILFSSGNFTSKEVIRNEHMSVSERARLVFTLGV